MSYTKPCPHCGEHVQHYRNPVPTVDTVIYDPAKGVVLIERKNTPFGWALPGGFVDYGETVEQAAIREALEETGLDVRLTSLLGVYSDPARDERMHTMSCVYVAQALDTTCLQAGDDAGKAKFFPLHALPAPIVFDHGIILEDFSRILLHLNRQMLEG